MKRISLILFLVLSVVLLGFTDDSEKQPAVQKNSFRVDPDLFGSFLSTVVVRPGWKFGFTLLGADVTVVKYRKWNFLGVGGGLAVHFERNPGLVYDSRGYGGYGGWRWKEYDTKFWPYLKLVLVKYRWDWASRKLKMKTYIGISITTKGALVFGLTFKDLFKKKKKAKH